MSNTPTAEEFLRALPPVLRNNSRMIALGQVVAEELSDRMSEIEKAAIYPRIDELDETLLDILAYDFKVDWYGYDYPLETKRALLKSSFYIHRHLGTKGAVEAAIQSVYPKSIVEEWFDYVEGGNPYTFRIVLDASTPAVPVNNTDLLRAVNLYKSLRSHLDGIMFRSTHRFEIRTGCGWCVYTARLCGTYPVQAREGAIYNFPVVVETEHGGEAYTMPPGEEYEDTGSFRTADASVSVIRVGDELARVLSGYGISVLHDRALYDDPEYNGAYYRAEDAIEAYMEKYPSIGFILDVHRDALEDKAGHQYKVVTREDPDCAQVSLVMGSSWEGWQENLKFAVAVQQHLTERYPTLMRPLTLRNSDYNEYFTPGSLLVEIGAAGNSLDEALKAVRVFGEGFAEVVTGK